MRILSVCGPGKSKGLVLVACHQITQTPELLSFVRCKLLTNKDVACKMHLGLKHDRLREKMRFGPQSLVPVGMLLQHLVETKSEGLVHKALLNKVLVDPELSGRDELPLRDAREVEAELPPVLLVEIITIHCGKDGEK